MKAIVTSVGQNVRAGPGMRYEIKDAIKRGDEVEILTPRSQGSVWAEVRVTKTANGIQVGSQGWVDVNDLRVVKAPSPPLPRPLPWWVRLWRWLLEPCR
jgi:uncharacterized protein YgiM (DUF1202 family)